MSATIPAVEPFAVRPKEGARLAGISMATFYQRLNAGHYESFLDGNMRLVTVESIRSDQRRKLDAARGTPSSKPSPAWGRRPKETPQTKET